MVLGTILIRANGSFDASAGRVTVMTVFALVQGLPGLHAAWASTSVTFGWAVAPSSLSDELPENLGLPWTGMADYLTAGYRSSPMAEG